MERFKELAKGNPSMAVNFEQELASILEVKNDSIASIKAQSNTRCRHLVELRTKAEEELTTILQAKKAVRNRVEVHSQELQPTVRIEQTVKKKLERINTGFREAAKEATDQIWSPEINAKKSEAILRSKFLGDDGPANTIETPGGEELNGNPQNGSLITSKGDSTSTTNGGLKDIQLTQPQRLAPLPALAPNI